MTHGSGQLEKACGGQKVKTCQFRQITAPLEVDTVAAMGCGYQRLIKNVRICLVGVTLFASSLALVAQQPSEPNPPRFDLTPLLGYRTPMSFQIEPHVSGTNPRAVFDADPSYGFAFGGHINDEDVV